MITHLQLQKLVMKKYQKLYLDKSLLLFMYYAD